MLLETSSPKVCTKFAPGLKGRSPWDMAFKSVELLPYQSSACINDALILKAHLLLKALAYLMAPSYIGLGEPGSPGLVPIWLIPCL